MTRICLGSKHSECFNDYIQSAKSIYIDFFFLYFGSFNITRTANFMWILLFLSQINNHNIFNNKYVLISLVYEAKVNWFLEGWCVFLAVPRQLNRWPHSVTDWLQVIVEKHYQRALWETCDPWDMWSEWWEDMT